ncbi:MAG TPA: excinuclease ABC subunit UvrC [Gammaproteobacteria bacterium]|nr:excinuclease ABC subunit UvrC [Gammaproteobacteria bacterium]
MNETTQSFDSRSFVRSLTQRPGAYCMRDAEGAVLYVGKARNLRKRVGSYFMRTATDAKTAALLRQTADVEVTVTGTEAEALLLEYNLIKIHKPRFNVVLRDDKSYPYIRVSTLHDFPRLSFYRGSRKQPGRYFGPYPGARAVRETLSQLQRLFMLRQCDDGFFRNRSRPCLQYQIQRCSAPCVGYIGKEDYARDVRDAIHFLEGRNREVTASFVRRMESAAADLDYERAARYRDHIATLNKVVARQFTGRRRGGDADMVAAAVEGGVHCVAVMFVRAGRNLGSRSFFPRARDASACDLLSAFLPQYYLEREAPAEIITGEPVEDADLLDAALTERAGHKVRIRHRVRGERARWLDMAQANAREALAMRLASHSSLAAQRQGLRELLGLDETPERIECFDVSHTGGESAVASCVVFGPDGPVRSAYRRFNIAGIAAGDDYAALSQVLTRRYTRIKRGEAPLPDVLLIDGGPGQVKQAAQALEELQVEGVVIVGVAKGSARRPGQERLFLAGRNRPLILPASSGTLHLIQQIRDEAHRFAITGHRQRRGRQRQVSALEQVPGLGPARRRALLRHFGGLQGVSRAGVDDLAGVKGISRKLAETVYDTFHSQD